MTKEMNKKIFLKNLQDTVDEIILQKNINPSRCRFKINPIIEQGKPVLAVFHPFVPIWIDVKLDRYTDGEAEFQLDCSLRLRKPSLLRNQESGHPPFRAVV